MQPRVLADAAFGRFTAMNAVRNDRFDTGPNLAVVQAWVALAGGHGGIGRRDLVGDLLASLVESASERNDLGDLLQSERQPAAQGAVQVGLRLERVRHVQGGTRCGHRDRGRRTRQRGQLAQRGLQVGAPDIASVNHSRHQDLVAQLRYGRNGRVSAVHQVDADRLDRRTGQARQGSTGVTEIGRDVDSGPVAHRAQRVVHRLGQRGSVGGDVGDQRGLVQLYPLCAVVG